MKAATVLLCLSIGTIGCGPNRRILDSASTPTPDAPAAAPLSGVEQEIAAMRTADFSFIYIFRRPDGGVLDAVDKKAASDNIPPEINRRKVIDQGRAVIVGSNYRLPGNNFKALAARFAVEDLSKPADDPANANVSTAR